MRTLEKGGLFVGKGGLFVGNFKTKRVFTQIIRCKKNQYSQYS